MNLDPFEASDNMLRRFQMMAQWINMSTDQIMAFDEYYQEHFGGKPHQGREFLEFAASDTMPDILMLSRKVYVQCMHT